LDFQTAKSAKSAKVEWMAGSLLFAWRPWSLGGKFSRVSCHFTPTAARVLVLKTSNFPLPSTV
jgi:hypothetical protein